MMDTDTRYKAKDGFVAREIAGEMLLIPIGTRTQEFNGIVRLNETGVVLWKSISEPRLMEDLVTVIADNFECSTLDIEDDVESFIKTGVHNGLIEELKGEKIS
ncbi:PqqD family protein [Alloiococcus sp. CFN-8]|uniref:PqqD family protein n=1 Tax=Alloiococcus sp. CFN-8 TaxID=3416081 RepID=UPI003CF87E8D